MTGVRTSGHGVGGVAAGFPVVGMIGGGQLARMSAQAASAMGIGLRVLARDPRESAARAGGDIWWGAHDDPDAVRAFAQGCDVVTFDHEHVPPPLLESLLAAGIAVRPGPQALIHAQDKVSMRRALDGIGVPVPAWREVNDLDDVAQFGSEHSWPVVLKVSRGGYDGRGVWVVPDLAAAASAMAGTELVPGAVWLVEAHVAFTRELAAQVARRPSGEVVAYPVVQTVQRDGICAEVVAPCPGLEPEHARSAQAVATRIAEELDVVGMLAVELFDTPAGVLVNELAMRPHNSGHWSIEGATTSQFANHLRAVLDLPLGSPQPRAPFTVMVNVLGGSDSQPYSAYPLVLADPSVSVHMYGKDARPGRKLGHVTLLGADPDDLLARGRRAAAILRGEAVAGL